MIYIISGTNRPQSRTLQVAENVLRYFKAYTPEVEIIDLTKVPLKEIVESPYSKEFSPQMNAILEKINSADGLVVVAPEYNGSMPGALKYFIDHWSYPQSFEYRPVAFIGLGFRWGGLRPVEHLQQVFNYRNAYVFPERVFLMNITNVLVDGKIVDDGIAQLLDKQARGFIRFIQALKSQNLHPNNLQT